MNLSAWDVFVAWIMWNIVAPIGGFILIVVAIFGSILLFALYLWIKEKTWGRTVRDR